MNDEIKIEKDMTPKLIGETYMKYPTEISPRKYSFGLYECQYCGKEFEAMTAHIKSGNTRSCGCQNGGRVYGLANSQFYNTWKNMDKRCNNPKNKDYKNYGARGITVCTDWQDLANFVSWAEETYIEGMTLDKENNDLGYNPENCRWVDKTTQQLNQRMHRNNTSGYVGIHWNKDKKKWSVRIAFKKERVHIGSFFTLEEAVQARDNYIIENKLPHKLSILNTCL